jgi:hypothetical protein
MRPDFKEKLESFFAGCQRIRAEHYAAINFKHGTRWSMTWLKRYVRIEDPNCYCFVEIETGEVLKSGGWKPAITKTRRGNIFDEHNGLKHIGPYGLADANEIKRTA